jgi:hypothetical protein
VTRTANQTLLITLITPEQRVGSFALGRAAQNLGIGPGAMVSASPSFSFVAKGLSEEALREAVVGRLQRGNGPATGFYSHSAATGMALISRGARPEGETLTAGAVVSAAQRLQAAAPVNAILVGERTYRCTREVIDYREADPIAGKAEPEGLPGWQVLTALPRRGFDLVREPSDNTADRDVPILAYAPGTVKPSTNGQRVETTQVAPTIPHLLGLDPNSVQAVQQEGTQTLPGIG